MAFAVLKNEPASGSALGDLMGFVEDVRAQAQKAGEAIQKTGARKIVVLDSYDAALMRHEYKDWGIELPEVVTATAFVDELIKSGKIAPRQESVKVSYHDGSRLARDLDEHQPARDILAALGCELKELFLNKRLARCCGSAVVRPVPAQNSRAGCRQPLGRHHPHGCEGAGGRLPPEHRSVQRHRARRL